MHGFRRTYIVARLTLLAWASVWMLAVPFFHVHLEADHHGEIGHIHEGVAHTVWSPDLDHEYDDHRHVDATEQSILDVISGIADSSSLLDSTTEFNLSLLGDSIDRKALNPVILHAFGISPPVVLDVVWHAQISSDAPVGFTSVLFLHALAPRAPPSILI
jgi:hypothetical protein